MTKNQVTTTKENAVALPFDYGTDAGRGMSFSFEDLKMPYAKLLQNNSPELKAKRPEYIEGAEEGDIFNPANKQLYKSLLIVPVVEERSFIEYKPDQGGFVAKHHKNSPFVAETLRNTKDKLKPKTKDGNQLVDTRSLFAIVVDEETLEPQDAIVLSFSSTKISELQDYHGTLKSSKRTKHLPLFAVLTRVEVVDRENKKGQEWKGYKLTPAKGGVIESLLDPKSAAYTVAKKMADSFDEGKVSADASTAGTAPVSDEGDSKGHF